MPDPDDAARIPAFADELRVDGTLVRIRPIRPGDREREAAFVRELSAASRYFRFHAALRELTPAMLERFTQVNYPHDMALVAVVDEAGGERQVGVARYVREPGTDTAEIAIVVADAWQGKGIATRLLTDLREVARGAGITHLVASVLRENGRMLELVRRLGFLHEGSSDGARAARLGKHVVPSDQRADRTQQDDPD
ncbi:MAG: GNAT family N-acetyltransferase [Pseudomonadales bacterium]